MSIWDEGSHTAPRHGGHRSGHARAAALAGLLAVALALGPAPAGAAADQAAPSVAPHANPVHRVSPYARFTREHAQSASRKPNRVRPAFSQGHAHRVNAHYNR
jgi:hypothetical protein